MCFTLPAFIQGLICSNCHPYLITYSKVTIKTQLEKIIKNALMNNLLLYLIIMILIIKLTLINVDIRSDSGLQHTSAVNDKDQSPLIYKDLCPETKTH